MASLTRGESRERGRSGCSARAVRPSDLRAGRPYRGWKEVHAVRVKDIMSTPVVTVGPEDSLKDVAALLVERRISAVPVVDEREELVGIVSEADLVPLETIPDPRSRITQPRTREGRIPRRVSDVMTTD